MKSKKAHGKIPNIPLEVQLVSGVKCCKTCKWFWGDDIPYGPYPSYDFAKNYPKEVMHEYNTKNRKAVKWMKVRTNGLGLIEPAVMSGCRKAPIMTIGINPNVTAFRPGPVNDTWAYPTFDNESSYAYYYRHKTIYQESFSQEFLSKHLSKKDAVRAKDDGWLIDIERSNTSRWMMLTIHYKSRGADTIELTWKPNEDYFVNYNKTGKRLPAIQFKKGATIAAKLNLGKNQETEAYHNITGYYERFTSVLEQFKNLIMTEAASKKDNKLRDEIAKVKLTVGEDVSQHDMIACASPGWTSMYDIPNKRVVQNCVEDNGWVVKQVIQSQPKIIVLVGGSSMSMFLGAFGKYANLDRESKDYFQIVRRTCEKKYYLSVKVGNFSFRSRIICSPHFSYPDNFKKQFRFLDDEWKTFETRFPRDFKGLQKSKKIQISKSYDANKVILVKDESILDDVYPDTRQVLKAHFYDVVDLMARAIKQEYDERNLEFDFEVGHLKRTDGPCHFCVNDLWEFPEGCAYKKPEEKPYPPGRLENIVQKVLDESKTKEVQDKIVTASDDLGKHNAESVF